MEEIKNMSSLEENAKSGDMNVLLKTLIQQGPKLAKNRTLVKIALAAAENHMVKDGKNRLKTETTTAPGIIRDQTAMSLSILNSVSRILMECKPSEATFQKASSVLGKDLLVEKKLREEKSVEFQKKFGVRQPSFLLISPTKGCNLHCIGCYADSDYNVVTLDWDIVEKMVAQANELWGVQFIVISGGEPMMYNSQGKGILDLVEKHPDMYFMFYTNGTLITEAVAQRMADLGNIVPMISLEGWKEKTDGRRGQGVFDKVMHAMDLLHDAGVLYGSSLTATRENAEELLSDEFIDFLFLKKHVALTWVFQYMPIGRSYTLNLMPTPEQRKSMWEQSWKLIKEKHYFIADFWNHGTVVDGCLSAGGHGSGGYFYIDWDGHVSPCVFLPFTPVNVKDIFTKGGNLNDIYTTPFFSSIRNWQIGIKDKTKARNLLNPCPMRDHNADLRRIIQKHEPDPLDPNAAAAIQDAEYAEGMDEYDRKYQQITDEIWEKNYVSLNGSQE